MLLIEKFILMKYLPFFGFIILLSIYGCNIDPDCVIEDTMPDYGLFNNRDDVEVQNIRFDVEAYDTLYNGLELIIQDSATYYGMKAKSQQANCLNCNYPAIDFSQKTLIGRYTDIGCEGDINIKFADVSADESVFLLKFVDNTQCFLWDCVTLDFIWILVDKIPTTTDIDFRVGKQFFVCEC